MRAESIEAALQNWALWKGGALGSPRTTGDLDRDEVDMPRAPHDGYRDAPVPIMLGLALDVDNIVIGLGQNQQTVLRAEYLGIGPTGEGITLLTQLQRAAWLACSLATYGRRLSEARRAVGDGLDARLRRMGSASLATKD